MKSTSDISVIIVSHSRPVELQQMLGCLRFQDVAGFQVIVVTNTPDAIGLAPEGLQVIRFDAANIAAARNAGLAQVTTNYVAFCDDDALPDPCWLRHLLAPFSDPQVGGAGGYTRGRNGISLQWGAVESNKTGDATPVEPKLTQITVFDPKPDVAPVMIGTNCAFRVSALRQIHGFDEVFAYYLDDSDISLRLSNSGWKLAIVPNAQVHHGFAAGPHRTGRRVPTTLELIGQSKAYFCRKHAPEPAVEPALSTFTKLHQQRLQKLFMQGLIPGKELKRVLQTLATGIAKGRLVPLVSNPDLVAESNPLPPAIVNNKQTHVLLAAGRGEQNWLRGTARELSANGVMVTALCLTRSIRYLQVRFSSDGYWWHQAGIYGKADRSEPLFRKTSKHQRIMHEARRLREFRPVDFIITPQRSDIPAIIPPQIPDIPFLQGCEIRPSAEFS